VSRFKESVADIEREVGRISTFLQCGDFDAKDIAQELRNVKECLSDVGGEIADTQEVLERVSENSGQGQRMAEELGWLEDVVSPLGMAEDALYDLAKDPMNKRLVTEVISQLDTACDMLTKAMEVT